MTNPVEPFLYPSGQREWVALFSSAEDRRVLTSMTKAALRSPAFDQLSAMFAELPGSGAYQHTTRHTHVRLDLRGIVVLGWDPDTSKLIVIADGAGNTVMAVAAGSLQHSLNDQQAWYAEDGEGWLTDLGRFVLVQSPGTTVGDSSGSALFVMPWSVVGVPLTIQVAEHTLINGLDYFLVGSHIIWRQDPRDWGSSDAYCTLQCQAGARFQHVTDYPVNATGQHALLRLRRDNMSLETLTAALAGVLGFPLWAHTGVVAQATQLGAGVRYVLTNKAEVLVTHEHALVAAGTVVQAGQPVGAPFRLLGASEYLQLDWWAGLTAKTLFGVPEITIPQGVVRAESATVSGLPVVYFYVDSAHTGAAAIAAQQVRLGGAAELWTVLGFSDPGQVKYVNLLDLVCRTLGSRGIICSVASPDHAETIRSFMIEEHPLNTVLLFHTPPVD